MSTKPAPRQVQKFRIKLQAYEHRILDQSVAEILNTAREEQAKEIGRVANLDIVRIDRVKEIELETRHDVMAMVKAMTEQCKGDAGKFVHYGATSNDIVDTATALQIKAAIEIIQKDVDSFIVTLAKLAKRERDTIEIGRTY